MRVCIVGGGIGGIAVALALRRHDLDYVVLEQAPQLTDVGAGIQLSPNGVRILEWLGLKEALREFSVEPRAHLFCDWQSGEVLPGDTGIMPISEGLCGAVVAISADHRSHQSLDGARSQPIRRLPEQH